MNAPLSKPELRIAMLALLAQYRNDRQTTSADLSLLARVESQVRDDLCLARLHARYRELRDLPGSTRIVMSELKQDVQGGRG